MKREIRNVAASKRERLANRARLTRDPFDAVVRRYFFERFLYRLSTSPVGERFILKGAMLLLVWAEQPYRATADLDLLRKGRADDAALLNDIRTIIEVRVDPDDGVLFDSASVQIEPVARDDEYAARRVRLIARLGSVEHRLQVDVGSGDAVWPAPKRLQYPVLLDDASPRVLAYSPETVVAEKVEAMVTLGMRNSRIKDFFDLHYFASHFTFDGATLAEALKRTFARRATPFPPDVPVALTAEYWDDSSRAAQMKAFARRARLGVDAIKPSDILPLLTAFIAPVVGALAGNAGFDRDWQPGGPWKERR